MQKVNPKISIIMGVYNCEDTIRESIESVINQTYKNWELIMCDDGSSDNTSKIISGYMKIDERLKLIKNNENKGLAFSLNKCIDSANGDLIARHDADDICILDRFEKQVDYFKKNKVDIIGTAVEYFDENGSWGNHFMKENPTKLDVYKASMFSHPTILIKKEAIQKVGKYTVSNITYRTEDYDLFAKLYKEGYVGANMQEILLKVRRNTDAYKRRKFKYRIDESRCKYKAFKMLNPGFENIYVCILPIIKGLIPSNVFLNYHNKKFKAKSK